MYGKAALDFASLAGYEQMITEPTHIGRRVLDQVRIEVHYFVEVREKSLAVTSHHSALFMFFIVFFIKITWHIELEKGILLQTSTASGP